MAVAKADDADLASGHKRKKQGDIIAVRPAGWQWGDVEVKHYLIVKIDLGASITTIQDAQKLTIPYFETGELWYPEVMPKILGKRRYKVPFTDLTAKAQVAGVILDANKMTDKAVKYQPIENVTLPFADLIYDKFLAKKLKSTDLIKIKDAGK